MYWICDGATRWGICSANNMDLFAHILEPDIAYCVATTLAIDTNILTHSFNPTGYHITK